jgi:phosphomethylpyrimidine synthase
MRSDVWEQAARSESVKADALRAAARRGELVLLRNRRRRIRPLVVGGGTRVKVNANIGTSPDRGDVESELAKLRAAVAAGADTVMDLSVGGDVNSIRKEVLRAAAVPVGTVPIYQVALEARGRGRSFVEMTARDMLAVVERHMADGVDFVTVHCGVTRENMETVRTGHRLCGVVSRGGAMTIEWMRRTGRENPLYEYYDELLALAREHCCTLSLGDGLRPGALADATDESQVRELVVIGELVERARAAGVRAMVEGPGHVPLDQIEANVRLEKSVCRGAPFYVLGPLVTDVACGYDHISGAIGGALAALYGADFLCYVTPSEHLGLPGIDDVREGVIASRIAAHAADVARHRSGAMAWDNRISKARAGLEWDAMIGGCVDPERARRVFEQSRSHTAGACTMCGEFCAIKKTREALYGRRQRRACPDSRR